MPQVGAAGYVDEWRARVHRKMLAMGERYLGDSGAGQFVLRASSAGQGPRSASEAMRTYRRRLDASLGRLPFGESAGTDGEAEDGEDVEEGR